MEINLLKGEPGIHSARWSGEKNNFDLAMDKIFNEMNKINKNWENISAARFVCCLTLFFPNGKSYLGKGIVSGKISSQKKGINGFGYDPIFIPSGHEKTFGEMKPHLKMLIDHRYKAYLQIKKFFD